MLPTIARLDTTGYPIRTLIEIGLIEIAMQLIHDTAIVTGAAQGIGRSIADHLVSEGASVAIVDINGESAAETASDLAEEYPGRAVPISCDVTDDENVATMVDETVDELGDVGMLVNNAGGTTLARTWEMEPQEWRNVIDLTLNSVFYCTREVLGRMVEEDIEGAIVNISSVNASAGSDGIAHYSAAKAGVSQFTEVVASEAGTYDIRVNAVAPGATRSEGAVTKGIVTGEMGDEFLNRTPLGRLGEPADVATVVRFLLSDEAAWITGETISVDGGQHVRGVHDYWDTLHGEEE